MSARRGQKVNRAAVGRTAPAAERAGSSSTQRFGKDLARAGRMTLRDPVANCVVIDAVAARAVRADGNASPHIGRSICQKSVDVLTRSMTICSR